MAKDKRHSKKYMVFRISDELYATPLSTVREVIGHSQPTPLPNSPSWFTGITNLRGQVISTIDLRARLGMKAPEQEPPRKSVIIFDVEGYLMGSVVDQVLEVMSVEDESIQKDFSVDAKGHRDAFIGAVSNAEDRLIILIDLPRLMSSEKGSVSTLGKSAA